MNLRRNPRHRHSARCLTASAMTLLIPIAIGCASPGNPRPPTLNLAEVVTDLTAQRIGNQVQLHWTTPSRTTDGRNLKGPLTAEFCRQTNPAAACTPVHRLPIQPGPTHAIDPLPSALTSDPVTLLAYRVTIFNTSGRSAGPSHQAFAAAGAAPPPVLQLRATATSDGAMIEWLRQTSATPVASQVGLDRALASPPPQKAPAKPATTQPLQFTAPKPSEVHLQTADDPGGTLDPTAQKGETYTYTAQRVRPVELNGHTLELRSTKSSPVTLLLSDTFPPRVPSGLAAVPGDANSIDLSWETNTESDLAGYIVYRQELTPSGQPQGTATRLTPTPVIGPAYRDLTASPGHRYAYQVTAIDATGNESKPSTPIQETSREQ